MSTRGSVAEFNHYLDLATDPKEKSKKNYYPINKICWLIDEGKIKSDEAIQAIHGKIVEENPEVVLHALEVLNTVFYKCGNLVHKVICTEFYMGLLKEIIQSSDHKDIKETVLNMVKEWADKLQYFPQYSAPQNLLQDLHINEVPNTNKRQIKQTNDSLFKESNGLTKPLTTEKYDKEKINKSNNHATNKDDADLEGTAVFKNALKEYQEKRKIDYNKYRAAMGLPPLSDEEDNSDTKMKTENHTGKKEEVCKLRKLPLPKELLQFKEQRQRLNDDIEKIRMKEHNNYIKSCDGVVKDMENCKDVNCKNCAKFKSKEETEECCIPKKLPYDIRKLVESKKRINSSIEDIKKQKQAEYYKKNNSMSSVTNNYKRMELDGSYVLKDSESDEDENLRKAISLSKEMPSNSMAAVDSKPKHDAGKSALSLEMHDEEIFQEALAKSRLEAKTIKSHAMATVDSKPKHDPEKSSLLLAMDYETILETVLAESRLEAEKIKKNSMTENKQSNHARERISSLAEICPTSNLNAETDENDSLQEAINRSFIEEEEKIFTPMPKLSEDDLIRITKKMCLEETCKSQNNNEEHTSNEKDSGICLICYGNKNMLQFKPCDHIVICVECAGKYVKQKCLLCYRYYEKCIPVRKY